MLHQLLLDLLDLLERSECDMTAWHASKKTITFYRWFTHTFILSEVKLSQTPTTQIVHPI